VRLLGELISGMELYHDGRTCFLICDRETCSKYGKDASEMEGLVNYALFTKGVQVGVLLREIEEKITKVSLRSNDSFDVGKLARSYRGGGHSNAAGCYIEKPIRKALAELLEQIGQEMAS
jgi:phosphoesterase RecJ-like protein